MQNEVKIIYETPDPLGVNRISMGGLERIGFYCVLRGNTQENIDIIKRCLKALEDDYGAVQKAQQGETQ